MALTGQREAELAHFRAKQRRIGFKPRPQSLAVVDQVEHFQRGGRNHRRQRVGEQVGPRALAQPLDHFLFADV